MTDHQCNGAVIVKLQHADQDLNAVMEFLFVVLFLLLSTSAGAFPTLPRSIRISNFRMKTTHTHVHSYLDLVIRKLISSVSYDLCKSSELLLLICISLPRNLFTKTWQRSFQLEWFFIYNIVRNEQYNSDTGYFCRRKKQYWLVYTCISTREHRF